MAAAKNTCNKGKGKTGGLSTAAVAAKRGASAAAAKAPTWTQAQREAQGDLRTLWKAAKKVGSLIYYKVAQTYAEGYKGLQKHRIKPCEVAAFVNISLRSYYRGRKLAESRYLMVRAVWEGL